MVENRLGLLFSQIAESIRGGLGDIGTLKPNAFPAKIDDIVALIGTGGGGSGGGESGSSGALTFASGSFPLIEDGQRVTIEHGLGVMPDLIIVQVSNYLNFSTYEEAAGMQAMMAAWGMRSTFGAGNHSGYTSTVWGLNTTYGIDNMPEKEQTYGYIFCPDENTFQVGSTTAVGKLYSKTGYRWLAVSGIGGMVSNPVIEPLNVTENGTYTAPDGVDGFSPVTVNVAGGVLLEEPIRVSGTFKPTSGQFVIQHNLGVVPDCIMIRNKNANDGTPPKSTILYAIGFRTGLSFSENLQDAIVKTDVGIQWIGNQQGIEVTGTSYVEFKNADATSVTVGGLLAKLDTTAEYDYFATRITPYE